MALKGLDLGRRWSQVGLGEGRSPKSREEACTEWTARAADLTFIPICSGHRKGRSGGESGHTSHSSFTTPLPECRRAHSHLSPSSKLAIMAE